MWVYHVRRCPSPIRNIVLIFFFIGAPGYLLPSGWLLPYCSKLGVYLSSKDFTENGIYDFFSVCTVDYIWYLGGTEGNFCHAALLDTSPLKQAILIKCSISSNYFSFVPVTGFSLSPRGCPLRLGCHVLLISSYCTYPRPKASREDTNLEWIAWPEGWEE